MKQRKTHDVTKCITTRYINEEQAIFVKISEKRKNDVVILNCDIPEELLRQKLIRKGYSVDKLLTEGIRLTEEMEFRFEDEGEIVIQMEERMWSPYHKGDTVKLYPNGRFETVSRWEKIKKACREIKEDIITAITECNNDLTRLVEELLP